MKHDIEEVLVSAIYRDKPTIIVEGKDDITIYEEILEYLDKKAEVIPVDILENYGDGCGGIIECFENVQIELNRNEINENYLLGIIDKDVRCFRGEMPDDLKGILVLQYYSIESHFVTDNHIKYLLSFITNVNKKFIDDDIIALIREKLREEYKELYYLSLEALKNACKSGYQEVLGYDKSAGAVSSNEYKNSIMEEIMNKRNDLDDFANSLNVDFNDIKDIAKGKWLLYTFCRCLFKITENLTYNCKNSNIKQCKYCEDEQYEKCLWKKNSFYQIDQIVNIVLNKIDINEIEYIKNEIKDLA